jgi:hypothetical protein
MTNGMVQNTIPLKKSTAKNKKVMIVMQSLKGLRHEIDILTVLKIKTVVFLPSAVNFHNFWLYIYDENPKLSFCLLL